MIATSNGHQQAPAPSQYTKEEIASSHLRVWVREVLRTGGLRAVLKIVKECYGHHCEIIYKV